MPGVALQNLWIDIPPIASQSAERLGYPTQKPLALLDRIIKASSNPNDIVLDAFCGCGTALVAAENLGRQWIGIDITHLAIGLIEKRIKDAFPNVPFEVHGTPKDMDSARYLANKDKYDRDQIAADIISRDEQDMHREIAPLKKAADAIEIDTTKLTIDEVCNAIVDEYHKRQELFL